MRKPQASPSTFPTSPKPTVVGTLPLLGAGGEPVSFARTVRSHGCAALAPARIDDDHTYHTTLRSGDRVVDVTLRERGTMLEISSAPKLSSRAAADIVAQVSRMFRLDDDLSPFYTLVREDASLGWAAHGAGRLFSSPTVFEDVIKTICTTNCAWSATVRMTNALVELGGGAFPTPGTIANTKDEWFRDVARSGYRGPYFKSIARDVASGALDLERMLPRYGMHDDVVEEKLLALPGVGPYAAAHIMQLLGYHRRLILDSWTRPTYLRKSGKKRATDTTIRRHFARYGNYAGLAFWLYLTDDWVSDPG